MLASINVEFEQASALVTVGNQQSTGDAPHLLVRLAGGCLVLDLEEAGRLMRAIDTVLARLAADGVSGA